MVTKIPASPVNDLSGRLRWNFYKAAPAVIIKLIINILANQKLNSMVKVTLQSNRIIRRFKKCCALTT